MQKGNLCPKTKWDFADLSSATGPCFCTTASYENELKPMMVHYDIEVLLHGKWHIYVVDIETLI